MDREALREHRERLAAMVEDDGDTWDLSENDQAACRAGAEAIAALLVQREATPPAPPAPGEWRADGPWLITNDEQLGTRTPAASEIARLHNEALRQSPAPAAPARLTDIGGGCADSDCNTAEHCAYHGRCLCMDAALASPQEARRHE